MNKEVTGVLTGKFFHSFKSDKETVDWAGQILGLASPGLYLVQLCGPAGLETRLVPATDMRYWRIYQNEDHWTEAREFYERENEKRIKRETATNEGVR